MRLQRRLAAKQRSGVLDELLRRTLLTAVEPMSGRTFTSTHACRLGHVWVCAEALLVWQSCGFVQARVLATLGGRSASMLCWRRRWRRPGWLQLMTSRDFGAISLINGIMFMTANGSRSVLVPLHGVQAFGLTTTIMGAPCSMLPAARPMRPLFAWHCSLLHVSCTKYQGGLAGSSKR